MAGEPFDKIVNTSILQTMTRSVNTLATVVITLVALLAFGGASLQNFAFALLVGICSGGYHSIFYSAPLVVRLARAQKRRARRAKRAIRARRRRSSGRARSRRRARRQRAAADARARSSPRARSAAPRRSGAVVAAGAAARPLQAQAAGRDAPVVARRRPRTRRRCSTTTTKSTMRSIRSTRRRAGMHDERARRSVTKRSR